MSTLKTEDGMSFNIPPGEPFVLRNNLPLRIKIKTTGGTVIEGVVLPNNPLTITGGNDILEWNYFIEDGLLGELTLLK